MERRPTSGGPRIRRSAPVTLLALLTVLVACAAQPPTPTLDPTPWDDPVDGVAAVTEWEDDGQPTTPFGPGGFEWASPDELLAAMAEAFTTYDGWRSEARVVERREDGAVIGWVRVDLREAVEREGPAEPVVVADMRVEMRNDGDGWFVDRLESRTHCAEPLTDGACR